MEGLAETLITLGGLLLLGFATEAIARHARLPRVTLLLIFGFLIGPSGLDLLPEMTERWFPMVADMALAMVGFLLGHKLTLRSIRRQGSCVMWISIAEVLATALAVFSGLLLVGVRLDVAILLAGIAPATAPAAVTDVVHELKARGPFAGTLLGVVAIDDAWGLALFSLLISAVRFLNGGKGGLYLLFSGFRELGGAILLGIVLGIPMAYLTGRVRRGEPTLLEALGMVFLCSGIALKLDVSFILASMAMGSTVVNLAKHHHRPFSAIEEIELPFMILFFVLAGASLELRSLLSVGAAGVAYVLCRILGRLAGAWVGGTICKADPLLRRWIGIALLPQAGVALGMALVAAQHFPDLADTILPVVLGATVFFELVGPVMTRHAIIRAGRNGVTPGRSPANP